MKVIYVLKNTVNQKVYVGQTVNLRKRLYAHFHVVDTIEHATHYHVLARKPLYRALAKYGIDAFKVEILEECNDEIANERECFWINTLCAALPSSGYNLTLGGEGSSGLKQTIETRQKRSDSLRGHACSVETRKKISEANKGRIKSEETRTKIRNNRPDIVGDKNPFFGRTHSSETKKKISASVKEHHKDPIVREKIGKGARGKEGAFKGHHHTDETKQKISESQSGTNHWSFGKIRSDDTRKKIRTTLKGHVVSEETKAKIRATLLKRKQKPDD